MIPELVIWGAGGHALVVADIVRSAGHYQIAGFIDDINPERAGSAFAGSSVLGGEERLPELRERGVTHLLPAVGDAGARLRMSARAENLGFQLGIAVHPTSVLASGVSVGGGTVVMAGVIVNAAAEVGRTVILNTACSVDHHGRLAEGVHVGPGARLGGHVSVDRMAWIGIGAVVRDRISIGEGSVVGAGAVVIRDVPPAVVVVGNPARILKPVVHAAHTS